MRIIILILFTLISLNMLCKEKISLKLEQQEIGTAMTLISKQTSMNFAYNPQLINTKHRISISINEEEVGKAVELLFNKYYTYTIKGKYIIITSEKKEPIYCSDKQSDTSILEAQGKKVSNNNSGIDANDCLSNENKRKPILEKVELGKPFEITKSIKEPIMLKKAASIIALSTLTLMPLNAVTDESITEPKEEFNPNLQKSLAHLSFLYPLGTDGTNSRYKEYNFSLNILGGVNGGVNGAEIGGIFNINKENVNGLQIAGVFNLTGGTNRGLQISGIFNSAKESKGLQIGGVMNNAKELSDIQISGILNLSKESSKVQIAGIVNYAGNVTTQISVVNIAKKAKFQLGIINISESDDAAMLGLFNYVKNGGLLEVGVSSGDYIYGATSLVSGTDKLYGILSMGIHSSTVSIGAGAGTRIQLGKSQQGINLELMSHQIYNNNFKNTSNSASLGQFKAFYSQRFNKIMLYGGPTVNVLLRDNEFKGAKDPIYSIFNRNGSKHVLDSWIGGEVGIRLNLK